MMPCYEIRIVSIEFKVGNIEILKKALGKKGWPILSEFPDSIQFREKFSNRVTINLKTGKMIGAMEGKQLSDLCNSVKRAYSEVVIDEVAKKQHWIKKKMGEGQYQLQRF